MKKFRAYVKLEDLKPTEMIISEKDKKTAKKIIMDFYHKLNEKMKVEVDIKEVYFDGNNYIEMEN